MTGKGTRLTVRDGARFTLGVLQVLAGYRIGMLLAERADTYLTELRRERCDHPETRTTFMGDVVCERCGDWRVGDDDE